jgi:hypothetical protein
MQATHQHAGAVLHAVHDDSNPYALPPPVPHAPPPPAPPRIAEHAPPDASGSLLKPRREKKSEQAPDDPSPYSWDETGLHVAGRPAEAPRVEQWEDDPNLPVEERRVASKPAARPEPPALKTPPPRPADIERPWAPPLPPPPAAHATESDENPYAPPLPPPAGAAAAPPTAPSRPAVPLVPEYRPPSPVLKAKEKLLDLAKPAAIVVGALLVIYTLVQGVYLLSLLRGDTTANQQPVVRFVEPPSTTVPQHTRWVLDLSPSDDPDGNPITFELRTRSADNGEVLIDDGKQSITTRTPFLTAERQITLVFSRQGTVEVEVRANDGLAFSAPKVLAFTVGPPIR